ncbi:MAG: DUF1761 domain-containing protein [Candidatus Pacebacteria bacterium]|nr:DUF1761 domain-containing protein [Candidatus Paceibacterota bacterium]MBP9851712.1 DUF1761 domain-containing protein [Candidatus Paceibacterota bacterium]
MIPINHLAVIVAAVAAFIVGFMFHGPLFGKLWMKLANVTPTGKEKFSDMYGQMLTNFVVYIITAYGFAVMYAFAFTSSLLWGATVKTGLVAAFVIWLGFLVTSSSMDVIWMKRSKKLWAFEAISSGAVMAVMALIISAW